MPPGGRITLRGLCPEALAAMAVPVLFIEYMQLSGGRVTGSPVNQRQVNDPGGRIIILLFNIYSLEID